MAELTAEILRIVSSPYAVSLKKLDSIVRSSPPNDLQCWADANPCQTVVLASSIVQALEFCPYALPVLERFGGVRSVRNAMLAEKRTLLETLLRSANRDGNNWEKYSPGCLALLSSPLPPEFSVPALIVPIFMRCVEAATKNPCAESIKNVYSLVSNGHGYLAELLTQSQKSLLTDRLSGFLTTSDNAVLLLALTTMSCIGAVLDGVDPGNTANKGEETRQKGGTKDFFSGRKAVKVMNLVTNIVIDVASRDSGELEYCIEQIKLATVIASNMSNRVRESLVDNTLNIRKLVEKIQRPGLEKRALREALNYAVALYPPESPIPALPPIIKTLSHQSIRNETQDPGSLFLPASMARILGTMSSQDYISDLMRSMFLAASLPPPMTSVFHLQLQDRIQFTASLSELVIESQQLRTAILSCLVTNEFSHPIAAFLSTNDIVPKYSCEDWEICPAGLLQLQNELAITICTLVLRAGVYSQKDESVGLGPSLGKSLLERQLRLSKVKATCSAHYSILSNTNSRSIMSIFETSATPDVAVNSRDWRIYLREAMLRDAARQNEVVVAEVGKICRNLEVRCEGIEKPLRDEEGRSERLRREIKDLKAQLEEETEERNSLKETLEHERGEFKHQLGEVNARVRDQSARIENFERELQAARDETCRVRSESQRVFDKLDIRHKAEMQRIGVESQEALDNLRSSHESEIRQVRLDSRESLEKLTAQHGAEKKAAQEIADRLAVEHIAVLNQRQEAIEEVEAQNRLLEQESDRLREALEEQRKENHAADEKIIQMDERMQNMDQELSELSLETECQRTDLHRKDNEIEKLERQLRAAETDAEENESAMEAEIERLENRLECQKELVQELERKVERTEKGARESIDHLEIQNNSNILRLKLDHEEDLRKLQAKLQKTREAWTSERTTLFTENKALTKKLKQLHAWQEKKAKETANLAQQLMSTATNRGLAALLPTEEETEAELQCPATTSSPANPLPSLPSITSIFSATSSGSSSTKRRTSLQDLETTSPNKPPPKKRTKTKPSPKAPVRKAKPQQDSREKENHSPEQPQPRPQEGELVPETPDDTEIDDQGEGSGGLKSPGGETSYGGSIGFGGSFSGDGQGGGGRGVLRITGSGRLDGDLGSEYDDTMDF